MINILTKVCMKPTCIYIYILSHLGLLVHFMTCDNEMSNQGKCVHLAIYFLKHVLLNSEAVRPQDLLV